MFDIKRRERIYITRILIGYDWFLTTNGSNYIKTFDILQGAKASGFAFSCSCGKYEAIGITSQSFWREHEPR
jgi:hypothetical protein